jgi:hypothetical protein
MPIVGLSKAVPVVKKPSRTPDSPSLVKALTVKKIAAVSKPLLPKAKPTPPKPAPPKPGMLQRLPDQLAPTVKTKPAYSVPKVQADPLLPDGGAAVVRRKPDQVTPKKEFKTAPPPPVQAHQVLEPGSEQGDAQISRVDPRTMPQKPEQGASIDLPLRKKIQSHKQITDVFKTLRPESFLPPISPPILRPQTRPMVAIEKYRPQLKSMDTPKEPIQKPLATLEAGLPQPGMKSIWRIDPERAPTGQQIESETDFALPSPWIDPLPMSLEHNKSPKVLPQIPLQPAVSPAEASQQTPKSPIDEEKPVQQPPILEPGEALVQRLTEDDYQSADSEQYEQQSAAVDQGESEGVGDRVNLDQLAEDLLPLVKRIIEIESERLSTNLR